MKVSPGTPPRISLLALPESSGSVLYGLYDVLGSVDWAWPSLMGDAAAHRGFEVQIVSPEAHEFRCLGGVPVAPQATLADVGPRDIVLISDLAIDNATDPRGRWPEVAAWLTEHYARGGMIGTVCTGSVLLADTGLLEGKDATTHWAYRPLFETYYPAVKLRPARILVAADSEARLVTTGGTASWEDLCLYLISRFCGAEEAVRTAKVYLLGDRSDGQLPFAAMVRPRSHGDAAVADCQEWIADHYAAPSPVARMVERSHLPERTFKRRFKAATGFTPVAYVQTLRIEEAKQHLERTAMATDEIAAAVGYEDLAFFRRLFRRHTGVTPARYRQRRQTMLGAGTR